MRAGFDHLDELKDIAPELLPEILQVYIKSNTNLFLKPLADIGFMTRALKQVSFSSGPGQMFSSSVVLSTDDFNDLLRHYATADADFSALMENFRGSTPEQVINLLAKSGMRPPGQRSKDPLARGVWR